MVGVMVGTSIKTEQVEDVAVLHRHAIERFGAEPQRGGQPHVFLLHRFEFGRVLHLEERALLEATAADDQELLEALSLSAAKVIQNTWLFEQLRLKARLLETLAGVGRTINSALNLDDALQVITREACLMVQARMSSLHMLDESREWLELRAPATARARPTGSGPG